MTSSKPVIISAPSPSRATTRRSGQPSAAPSPRGWRSPCRRNRPALETTAVTSRRRVSAARKRPLPLSVTKIVSPGSARCSEVSSRWGETASLHKSESERDRSSVCPARMRSRTCSSGGRWRSRGSNAETKAPASIATDRGRAIAADDGRVDIDVDEPARRGQPILPVATSAKRQPIANVRSQSPAMAPTKGGAIGPKPGHSHSGWRSGNTLLP